MGDSEEFAAKMKAECAECINESDSVQRLLGAIRKLKSSASRAQVDQYSAELGEKSGKSSLINAWIETSLLPTAAERCTYTTTEVKSCLEPSQQVVKIEYYTREEFDANKQRISKELAGVNLQPSQLTSDAFAGAGQTAHAFCGARGKEAPLA